VDLHASGIDVDHLAQGDLARGPSMGGPLGP